MAWELLFTSDIGLLSLFTIVFIRGGRAHLSPLAPPRMGEEEQKARTPR